MEQDIGPELTVQLHEKRAEIIQMNELSNADAESRIELPPKAIASPASCQNVEEKVVGK